MIKNDKKDKIRDISLPFQLEMMSDTAVRPSMRSILSGISSHRNGN